MNYIDPEREHFQGFKDLPDDRPIHMLNLVKLKPTAVYEDGTMLTGHEAYHAYGRDSSPVLKRVGGHVVWSGSFEFMVIGPNEEKWDLCFIAQYPSAKAFMEMLRDPAYREAVKHRQAAVETSRLIRLSPNEVGEAFG